MFHSLPPPVCASAINETKNHIHAHQNRNAPFSMSWHCVCTRHAAIVATICGNLTTVLFQDGLLSLVRLEEPEWTCEVKRS